MCCCVPHLILLSDIVGELPLFIDTPPSSTTAILPFWPNAFPVGQKVLHVHRSNIDMRRLRCGKLVWELLVSTIALAWRLSPKDNIWTFRMTLDQSVDIGKGAYWCEYWQRGILAWILSTRSLGALWAPTSSWRPFGPLDFVLRALRALRPIRQARLRSGPPFLTIFIILTIFDHFGSFWIILTIYDH